MISINMKKKLETSFTIKKEERGKVNWLNPLRQKADPKIIDSEEGCQSWLIHACTLLFIWLVI